MGTERKNYWKMFVITRGSKLNGNTAHDPDLTPLEPHADTPMFDLGTVVKLSKERLRKASDSGKRAVEGNYGSRFLTPEDRLRHWDEHMAWRRSDHNAVPATLDELLWWGVQSQPAIGVHCKFTDLYTVVLPDCTALESMGLPRWDHCEVRNVRTGEQFVIARNILELV